MHPELQRDDQAFGHGSRIDSPHEIALRSSFAFRDHMGFLSWGRKITVTGNVSQQVRQNSAFVAHHEEDQRYGFMYPPTLRWSLKSTSQSFRWD